MYNCLLFNVLLILQCQESEEKIRFKEKVLQFIVITFLKVLKKFWK